MRFSILGPLEIHDGEHSIEVNASMERTLLGVLIVHTREVLAVDVLVDVLWGSEPPSRPRAALQFHVSKLRATLGPDAEVVVTRMPGYVLDVEAEAVDANRFRRLTHEGRAMAHFDPQPAAALLRDALAIWRGDALIDFVDRQWAAPAIAELEALRLSAHCARIDIDVAAGQAADVVAELRELTAMHPLNEALWGQLVRALAAADRRAEAMMAYREVSRLLAAEGLRPSPRLRREVAGINAADVVRLERK